MKDNPLVVQKWVISALILRDMRTRFGGTYLSFSIAVLWPLSHLAVVALIQILLKRPTPRGDSNLLFYCTGLLPYIAFYYTSRNLSASLGSNKPLLYFPVVKSIDIIIARLVIEVAIFYALLFIVMAVMYIFDVDIRPQDIMSFSLGLLLSLVLGISIGIFNCLISSISVAYAIAYAFFCIIIYLVSGVLFDINYFPDQLIYYLSFNPLFHIISLTRAGYYMGYGDGIISLSYVFAWCLAPAAIGLGLDRLLQGRILR